MSAKGVAIFQAGFMFMMKEAGVQHSNNDINYSSSQGAIC